MYMWYLVHDVDSMYVQYVCCSGDCVYMSVFVHMCKYVCMHVCIAVRYGGDLRCMPVLCCACVCVCVCDVLSKTASFSIVCLLEKAESERNIPKTGMQ